MRLTMALWHSPWVPSLFLSSSAAASEKNILDFQLQRKQNAAVALSKPRSSKTVHIGLKSLSSEIFLKVSTRKIFQHHYCLRQWIPVGTSSRLQKVLKWKAEEWYVHENSEYSLKSIMQCTWKGLFSCPDNTWQVYNISPLTDLQARRNWRLRQSCKLPGCVFKGHLNTYIDLTNKD